MDTQDAILDRIRAKDELVFGVGDTLDTKASFAIVVITFLVTQTAWFITEEDVSGLWLVLQSVSAVALGVGGALAIAALWPRHYDTDAAEKLDEWVAQLNENYKNEPDVEREVAIEFARQEIKRGKERIAKNSAHNNIKSNLIEWSFRCSAFGFLLNLLTVIDLAIHRVS
jgi:hypothetical protein